MTSTAPTLERISVVVAWMLCVVILWSFFGGWHQLFVPDRTAFHDVDLVNAFMWFCPAFVLLIFRRYWFVVAAYAVPILVLLAARIYFFWRLETLGTNVVYQSGYWVVLLQFILSVFSFFALVCWIGWCFIFLTSRYAGGDK